MRHPYYIIKIALNEYEDRLYRIIEFNVNNDIDELAFTILSIFNTLSYHLYRFIDDDTTYQCEIGIENALIPEEDIPSKYRIISHLNIRTNTFKMVYDYGENYVFNIQIVGLINKDKFTTIPNVIDGRGYGISEDNHYLLEEYLNGNIKGNIPLAKGNTMCANIDFEYFNLEEINKHLRRNLKLIRASYFN